MDGLDVEGLQCPRLVDGEEDLNERESYKDGVRMSWMELVVLTGSIIKFVNSKRLTLKESEQRR